MLRELNMICCHSEEYHSCNNKYMKFCNPKSAIYQVNLSKSCVIALFLKHTENIKQFCKSVVQLDARLPVARYIHSGMWVIATDQTMKLTVVCQDPSDKRDNGIVIHPPLGLVKLDPTCQCCK